MAVNTNLLLSLVGTSPLATTPGSIPFVGSSGRFTQNNTALSWSDTNTRLSIYDKNATSTPFLSAQNHFLLGNGATNPSPISMSGNFIAAENTWTISPTGTSKFIANQVSRMYIKSATGSTNGIYGLYQYIDWREASNATNSVYGTNIFLNLDGLFSEGYGISINAAHGGSGASGSNAVWGIKSTAGIAHNGTLSAGYSVEGHISSSSGTSTTDLAACFRATTSIQSNVTCSDLIGLLFNDWSSSGTVTRSYAIYADTSIDIGTTKYFIYSLSTSPSVLAGDIEITDNTKGFILRSPNNSRFRITVDNAGALATTALDYD